MSARGHKRFNRGVLREFRRLRTGDGKALEAHFVARLELADFPQLALHDGRRTDEAAEARAVGAEDDRHVAGEIDRADGVGVVVDVRRMQAGLAAVLARPTWLRADQAHPGARGIVVHLVGRGKKISNVVISEKIRRAVRAVENTKLPLASDRRDKSPRQTREWRIW